MTRVSVPQGECGKRAQPQRRDATWYGFGAEGGEEGGSRWA